MHSYKALASKIFLSPYHCQHPVDLSSIFNNDNPVCVEIGFGHGEYLLSSIDERPEFNFIGIELDWNRIKKCFKAARHLPSEKRQAVESRLKVFKIDAWAAFERLFNAQTIAGIECLFPCPWPKDCHEHHRLFSHDFLRLLNSRLIDGGEVRLVTDYQPYAQWVLDQSASSGFNISEKLITACYNTKFERKWQAAGQQQFYEMRFLKKQHVEMPLKEDVELKAYYHQEFDPEQFKLEEHVTKDIAVIPKDWAYDPVQKKGLARLVVSEEHLTQHVWVVIIRTEKGWGVFCAEGQQILSTPGIAKAIELVAAAVGNTRHSCNLNI